MKHVLNALATILMAPVIFTYRIAAAVTRRPEQAFQGMTQLLSLLPGRAGTFLRRAFYRATLRDCSSTCIISFGTIFSTPEAVIGSNVYIGAFCSIGMVTIEDDVLIGSNVDIVSGRRQHHADRLDVPIRLQGGTFERITIGRDSWLGNGCIVAADIGEQSIVALGAVVVSPVAPRSVVGGNPARVLKRRTGDAGTLEEPVLPAGIEHHAN